MRSSGTSSARSPETVNPKVTTGEIEIRAREIRMLNDAKTPPFPIADESPVSEDTRLKYRYLDLRRSRMQNNIALRHRVTMDVRKYFDEQGFLEIETPMLTKSTPEGARDYLVPSRVHPGEFYALPQSPQIFKQILMISGMDRYFQIVKCFRDEDLRADRQPEFTQVDLEMSFATEDLVFSTIEPLMGRLMALIGRDAPHAVPAHAVRRGDRRIRIGQARPRVAAWRSAICRRRSPSRRSRVFRDGHRGRRRSARLRRCQGGEVFAPRGGRDRRAGEAARRGRTRVGAGTEGTVQSSALKAAGEDDDPSRPARSPAPGRAICC